MGLGARARALGFGSHVRVKGLGTGARVRPTDGLPSPRFATGSSLLQVSQKSSSPPRVTHTLSCPASSLPHSSQHRRFGTSSSSSSSSSSSTAAAGEGSVP